MIRVVDGVLEDIRLGLELNLPKMNQRRVSSIKFVGELYTYQLLESNVIFRTLYLLLQFASSPDGKVVSDVVLSTPIKLIVTVVLVK